MTEIALDGSFLVDLAMCAWRLRRRVTALGSTGPEDLKALTRLVDQFHETLLASGIVLIDHTNESAPPSGVFQQRILAFEQTPGLEHERVIETVKPTIRFGGHVLQVGEVIMGVPAEAEKG